MTIQYILYTATLFNPIYSPSQENYSESVFDSLNFFYSSW